MIPTAPNLPSGGPGPAPLVDVTRTPAVRDAAPAVAPPERGAAAVTQPDPGRLAPQFTQSPAPREVPEIPPDPPPVKGLGIPPLNTRVVGDFDEIESPPPPEAVDGSGAPAISDLLQALQDTTPPGLDRRA